MSNVEENYNLYKSLLRSTNRNGIDELIDWLDTTDFKVAPASTKYHGAYAGGLCQHCLDVYNVMLNTCSSNEVNIPIDSIILVTLLHDLSKVNNYEATYQNYKNYRAGGSKYDANGAFDWDQKLVYKTREDAFVFGNHEQTCEFIARQFVDLKIEESIAILNHHGGLGWDSIPKEFTSKVYSKYPIALYLHIADLICAYTKA